MKKNTKPVFETVLFDLDGTLLNSADSVIDTLEFTLAKFGKKLEEGFDKKKVLGPSMSYSLHHFFGFSEKEAEQAAEIFRERYKTVGAFETRLFDGAYDLVEDLHKSGAVVCVATSRNMLTAKILTDRFGLSKFVSFHSTNNGDPYRIDKFDIVANALTAVGADKSSSVMVGDTRFDAEGALQNGIPFIGMLYGYGTKEELKNAGASMFAQDIAELRDILFA